MQPQIKRTIIKTTHILAHTHTHTHTPTHTHTSGMHALCFKKKKKMQFTKCSPHTVIDVVLWFYILLMMFTFQFHSYVCFCVLRGK